MENALDRSCKPGKRWNPRIGVALAFFSAALSMAGGAAAQSGGIEAEFGPPPLAGSAPPDSKPPAPAVVPSGRIEAESGVVALLESARADWNSSRGASFEPVGVNGASRSIAKLCRGEIAAVGSARPISASERAVCTKAGIAILELPLGRDGIVVAANPRNTWAQAISAAELQQAWLQGAANPSMTWRHVNPAWADAPLKLYGPGPTLALYAQFETALGAGGSGSRAPLRRDVTASDSLSVVADGIARDRESLGLLDSVTYSANAKRLRRISLSSETDKAAFEFSVSLIVAVPALRDTELAQFLDYVLVRAAELAPALGLQALAETSYSDARAQLASQASQVKGESQ